MPLADMLNQAEQASHDVTEDNVVHSLGNGTLVKYVVADLRPTKAEADAVGGAMPGMDLCDLVPWKDGIYLDYIYSAICTPQVDEKGTFTGMKEEPLWTVDAAGNVTFAYPTPHYYMQVDSIRAQSLSKMRFYNERHSAVKIALPEDFDAMDPVQRFTFWAGAISRKHGQKLVTPGTQLYGYISKRVSGEVRDPLTKEVTVKGQWYTSIERSYKDSQTDQWSDLAPWDVTTIPADHIAKVRQALRDEIAAKTGKVPF